MGAGRPGPVPCPPRGAEASQLEDDRGGGRRHPGPGRLLGGQGVRDRVDHRGLPDAARHRGKRRVPEPALTRCRTPRGARTGRPTGPDQHLRRWGQRDPTGDPGHGRPGYEAVGPMSAQAQAQSGDLEQRLSGFAGQSSGASSEGPDEVNQAMIRHWVEAMGDTNPVYVDDAAAKDAGFPGVIAPPTMLQAWIMRGLRASQDVEAARAAGTAQGDGPTDRLMSMLDEAGFTSVVATNCDQHYVRPLVPGDQLEVNSTIDAVSGEKQTGLGVGHFITTRLEFTDQDDQVVATMLFRILKFRPRTPVGSTEAAAAPGTQGGHQAPSAQPAERPKRPRPALTQDNSFFFEGARQRKLLIQRCAECGTLRHPPRPSCANCRSFDWDTVTASGRGTIYSYVVNHHPQVPAFDYPLVVALVELEEGTRLVANVSGITPETVAIGMVVQAEFEAFDDELTLPVFRPVVATATSGGSGSETRKS